MQTVKYEYWKQEKPTKEGDFKVQESRAGVTVESEGLWNSKCAIDRSIGFVSVSMSIYPVDLKYNPFDVTDQKVMSKKRENLLHVLFTSFTQEPSTPARFAF